MKMTPTRRSLLVVLPLGILIGAAGALAANAKLEEADGHVDKALAALKQAYNPKIPNQYGGHGKRAIELLDDVKREIAKAKAHDDRHPDAGPGPKDPGPGPKPTSSGPGPKPPGPGPKPTSSGPGPKPPGPGPKDPGPGPKPVPGPKN
jgi:hypothetical protein